MFCRAVLFHILRNMACSVFTVDAAVHIAPFAHLLGAFDVVVSHVHSARIGYLSVDDYYLAVVAMQHVVDPRKAYRVEFEYLDAFGAYAL